eukprot:m.3704 g.3704  ORF g.3704 m.3704 type:complete len:533 (+) comp9715_c0_seq1:216-1814(+)
MQQPTDYLTATVRMTNDGNSDGSAAPPSGETEWLNKLIVISVPALTGLLLLALLAFGLLRFHHYTRRRRRAPSRRRDDSEYETTPTHSSAPLPPQYFFRDPTQALKAARSQHQKGTGPFSSSRYSEGSDAFPDNYRSYYGSADSNSQPGSESTEVNLQRVSLVEEIGRGCFTKVYVAMLTKNSKEKDFAVQVAVKQLQTKEVPISVREEFAAEVEMLREIGKSPYIVQMLGYGTRNENLYVITEYAELGNLQNYLRNHQEATLGRYRLIRNLPDLKAGLTEVGLLAWAEQVSLGMEYIACRDVVHGDLAARNILVFSEQRVKISDFGLSHHQSQSSIDKRLKGNKLPLRWMAPEAIFQNKFSLKSDIWAFGILLWEIVTLGHTPYPGLTESTLTIKLKKGCRLSKPSVCSNHVYNLMRECWHARPAARPTSVQVRERLAQMNVECQDNADSTHLDYSRVLSLDHLAPPALVVSEEEITIDADVFASPWAALPSVDSDSSSDNAPGKLKGVPAATNPLANMLESVLDEGSSGD